MPLTRTGRRIDFTLPDPEALGLPWPELQKAIETHARLLRERQLTARRLDALEDDRRRAVEGDRKRLARAIRDGKPEPEPKATQKVEAEMAGARRRLDALGEAVEEAEAELVAVVDEFRERWAEDVAERIAKGRVRYAKAIEILDGARDDLMSHLAVEYWLRTFPENKGFRVPPGLLRDLVGRNGDPYAGPAVIAALRDEAAPPVASASTPAAVPS